MIAAVEVVGGVMETIFQLFLTTVQIGSVYVLFALGLTIIFGVLRS